MTTPEAPNQKKASSFEPATYELVDLDDQGDELYIGLLSRSYTRKELENPALMELLVTLGWPHVKKSR